MEGEAPVQVSKPKPPSPAQKFEVKVTPEEDEKKEHISQGMKLLLAARDRVLTLTERRVHTPQGHIGLYAHLMHATDPDPNDTRPNVTTYDNVHGPATHCR